VLYIVQSLPKMLLQVILARVVNRCYGTVEKIRARMGECVLWSVGSASRVHVAAVGRGCHSCS